MSTFVKRVPPVDGGPARSFLREREVLTVVRHPGVVELVEAAVDADGTGTIVTRHVAGPTVRELLAGGPLPSSRAITIVLEVLDALAAVHAAGFVHGDVKPENVVVGERAVLVDFGLAMPIGSRWPDEGAGTPAYMAPEQLRRELVDPRTDLYAACAMLYELVSGAPPYTGASGAELRRRQLTSRPVPLSVVLGESEVSDELSELVQRGLAKSPEERPASALELATLIASIAR